MSDVTFDTSQCISARWYVPCERILLEKIKEKSCSFSVEAECKDHVVAERVKTLGPARTGLLDTRPRWRFAANCRHFSLHTLPLLFSFFVPSCGPSPSSESRGESVRARAGHGRGTATDTSSSSRFTLSLVRRLPLFLFVGRFVAAGLFLLFCRLFVVGVFFDGCVRAALFQTRKTTARGKINWRGIFRGGTFCPFSSILTSLFIPWSFASPPSLYPLFLRFHLRAFHQRGIWSTAQMGDVWWHNRSS